MKKYLYYFALLLCVFSFSSCASKKVAFFFFNNQETTVVEDEFIKVELTYFYGAFTSKQPDFSAKLVVTNKKPDQTLYFDKGNSFFYSGETVRNMFVDKTTDIGNITVQEKRIEPLAPNGTYEVWKDELGKSDAWKNAKWYVGMFPKAEQKKLGASKKFDEGTTPFKLKCILTYSLSENMEEPMQIETNSFVQEAIIDKKPKPIALVSKQGKGSVISLLKGKSRLWTEWRFNFKKSKFAQRNPNAFYFIDATKCLEEEAVTKTKKGDVIR